MPKKPKPRKQPKKSPISKPKQDRKKGKPHRFKKGQSGNPKGRPLGSKNFKTAYELISAILAAPVHFPGGETRFLTGKEQIAFRRFTIALKGPRNAHAIQRAMDSIENRIDGMPVQAVKNVGDGSGKLHITVSRSLKDKENPNVEVKEDRTEPTETKQ